MNIKINLDLDFQVAFVRYGELMCGDKNIYLGGDVEKIEQQLKALEHIETQLRNTNIYLQEYRQLVDNLKDSSSQTHDLETIKNLVGKRTNLTQQKNDGESNLLRILGALLDLEKGDGTSFEEVGYKPIDTQCYGFYDN